MSKKYTEKQKQSIANYWKSIKNGYQLIVEAKAEASFQKWKEANRDSLACHYDSYQEEEYQSFQWPQSFDDWAFERWLMDECWNEQE